MDKFKLLLDIAAGNGTRRERVDRIKTYLEDDLDLLIYTEQALPSFRPPVCEHPSKEYPVTYNIYATLCMAIAEVVNGHENRKDYYELKED
jgi:hypothetical protein